MANKNQKHEKQPEQQPSEQLTTPVAQVELTDEQLEQVVGGCRKAGGDRPSESLTIQPNPTAVE